MAFDNLTQFNRDLQQATTNLEQRALPAFLKKVGFELLIRTVINTPVDTGRACGNWRLSINTFPTAPTASIDKDGSATIRSQQQQNLAKLNSDPFVVIYLTNNLPYIVALEHGHSGQAPYGMLGLAFEEVRQMFNNVED